MRPQQRAETSRKCRAVIEDLDFRNNALAYLARHDHMELSNAA